MLKYFQINSELKTSNTWLKNCPKEYLSYIR